MSLSYTELRTFPRVPTPNPDHCWFPLNSLRQHLPVLVFDQRKYYGIERLQKSLHTILQAMEVQESIDWGNKQTAGEFNGAIFGILSQFGDMFGLLSKDGIRDKPESYIYTADRYHLAVNIAQQWADDGETIGILHGAMDGPHLGHGYATRESFRRTTKSIVCVDPNWLVKFKQTTQDDPRPRIASIVWKLWQFAILPTVDMVIEAPIRPGENPQVVYPRIYDELHITRLATRSDHPLYHEYEQRMRAVNGEVVPVYPIHWAFKMFDPGSSTARRRKFIYKELYKNPKLMRFSEYARELETQSAEYERRVQDYWNYMI